MARRLDSSGNPLLDPQADALHLAELADLALGDEDANEAALLVAVCPDAATLERYAAGRTRSDRERRRIWRHLDICLPCRQAVGET